MKTRLVVGYPGTGKTTAVKNEMMERFDENTKLFVLGVGDTLAYKELQQVADGHFSYVERESWEASVTGDMDIFSLYDIGDENDREHTIRKNIEYITDFFVGEFDLSTSQRNSVSIALMFMYRNQMEDIQKCGEQFIFPNGFQIFLAYLKERDKKTYELFVAQRERYDDEAAKLIHQFTEGSELPFMSQGINIWEGGWNASGAADNYLLLLLKKNLNKKKKNIIVIEEHIRLWLAIRDLSMNDYDIEIVFINANYNMQIRPEDELVSYKFNGLALKRVIPREWDIDDKVLNVVHKLDRGESITMNGK